MKPQQKDYIQIYLIYCIFYYQSNKECEYIDRSKCKN